MARKLRQGGKFAHAAHIKKHTKGTSNEISFSVLDAAKMTLDGEADPMPHGGLLGHIPLFTLPGKRSKKVSATPTKEQELVLPSSESLQGEGGSSVAQSVSSLNGSSSSAGVEGFSLPLGLPISPFSQKGSKNQGETLNVSRETEVARRKARRRLYRFTAVAFVVMASVGLLSAAGSFLYSGHQKHVGYVGELKAALEAVEQVDETLVLMDASLENPEDPGSLETMAELLGSVNTAQEQLEQAQDKVTYAFEGLQDSTADKEAAGNAAVAISSRMEMLVQGESLMTAALECSEASEALSVAWERVLEGDSLAREAAQLVSTYTVKNIEASRTKTEEALEAFVDAQAQIDKLAATHPQLDVSLQQEYLQKRIEAQRHAEASDDAMLAEDASKAAAENESYNEAESQAAVLAESLPEDPSAPAKEQYAAAVKEPAEAYEEARSQAASVDAFLRDYLGSFTK